MFLHITGDAAAGVRASVGLQFGTAQFQRRLSPSVHFSIYASTCKSGRSTTEGWSGEGCGPPLAISLFACDFTDAKMCMKSNEAWEAPWDGALFSGGILRSPSHPCC